MAVDLKNRDGAYYFQPFDKDLRIAKIIVGARCTVSKHAILDAIEPHRDDITIKLARAACNDFKMVEDDDGFNNDSPFYTRTD